MSTVNTRLNYSVGGMGDLADLGDIMTGINQTVELVERAFHGVSAAITPIVATGSVFEQFTVQFETLLGTATAASERMDKLFDFAAYTPYQLDEVVEAAKSLEAYGIYTERALIAAGDAAAASPTSITPPGTRSYGKSKSPEL